MKDFRKGFCVAFCAMALVVASTMVVKAEEEAAPTYLVPGLSVSFGSGFTSEFGGLGATVYKNEAAHEKVMNGLAAQSATLKAKYNGDKGGSLVALIPEVMVRYDITDYFFVRLGYQGGVRITGGQWSVSWTNPAAAAPAHALNTSMEQINYALWVAGCDQIGNNGKTTYDYKFSSHEIPFVLGLNVPVKEGKYNVYAAMGIKYAFYIFEKTIKYSSTATNVGITNTAANGGTDASYVDAVSATAMARERVNTKMKYNLHGMAVTWLIGVDAKIYQNLGAYLETEFTTNTDSSTVKQNSSATYKNAGAISSGTCRYYKVGVKYWI